MEKGPPITRFRSEKELQELSKTNAAREKARRRSLARGGAVIGISATLLAGATFGAVKWNQARNTQADLKLKHELTQASVISPYELPRSHEFDRAVLSKKLSKAPAHIINKHARTISAIAGNPEHLGSKSFIATTHNLLNVSQFVDGEGVASRLQTNAKRMRAKGMEKAASIYEAAGRHATTNPEGVKSMMRDFNRYKSSSWDVRRIREHSIYGGMKKSLRPTAISGTHKTVPEPTVLIPKRIPVKKISPKKQNMRLPKKPKQRRRK